MRSRHYWLYGNVHGTPSDPTYESGRERKRQLDSLESQGVYPTVDSAGRWGRTIEAIE